MPTSPTANVQLGIASGLDLQSLTTKLLQAEAAPTANALKRKEDAVQAKISAFGDVKTSLSSLQDLVKGLTSMETYQNGALAASIPPC